MTHVAVVIAFVYRRAKSKFFTSSKAIGRAGESESAAAEYRECRVAGYVGRQKMYAVRWPAVRSVVCDRGWLFVLAVACHGKDIIRLSLKWKGHDITRQSSVPVGVYSRMRTSRFAERFHTDDMRMWWRHELRGPMIPL